MASVTCLDVGETGSASELTPAETFVRRSVVPMGYTTARTTRSKLGLASDPDGSGTTCEMSRSSKPGVAHARQASARKCCSASESPTK